MIVVVIIVIYLALLLVLGGLSSRRFRNTSDDFFLASRSIGPFLLVMSLFGTTMTAFALVGSTGKAYEQGIGVYGLMASWSGLIHSAVFFLVGIKLWALGKRYGYVTQTQYFRDRFGNEMLGRLLFPILVALVVPYLLIGLMAAGVTVEKVTAKTEAFGPDGVPGWITAGVICLVVYTYVFFGGLRAAAWANAFQTIVFLVVGLIAFFLIADSLGGVEAATAKAEPTRLIREGSISRLHFTSYLFIPLSVGMFPHLFQHWLTARSARTFKAPVVLHPVLIMLVWVPCILIGVWATGALGTSKPPNAILGIMVGRLQDPYISGLVTAGILAAIMSSLDSQFLCLGTMFSQDVIFRMKGSDQLTDSQKLFRARLFVGGVILCTYLLSLVTTKSIFDLAVWCFSGFAGLFPLVLASLYWKRTTAAGAIASICTTAAVWLILFLQSPGKETLILGMMPVVFIVLASTVSLIVVSLGTKPVDSQRLQRFFPMKDESK
ncbi:MAG: sodium:proline symporter [Myxococcales bacterium]|nr:sodium:proline symporter [Myxococcales bacterium]